MKLQSQPKKRILYYAINGLGVGHVKRLIALARPLRQLALETDIDIEQIFLTSSEAGQILFMEGFAYLKLASLSAVEESGMEKKSYVAFAREWVRQTVALLNPDIFVVDTLPEGAFQELCDTPSTGHYRLLIYRPCRPERAREERFQAALKTYDQVLIPEHKETSAVIAPESLNENIKYYGPVITRDRQDLLSRDTARSRLGLDRESLVIYVSFGGGGDPEAQTMLDWILLSLNQMNNVSIVVGAGPLYRGVRHYTKNCVWLVDASICELMNAFDLAVSAAGYNSFCELMHFGVPTIFVPLPRVMDDQEARAERAVRAGAGQILQSYATGEEVRSVVASWLSPEVRAEAAKRAGALVPYNHAKDMARDILATYQRPMGNVRRASRRWTPKWFNRW
jgi:UDP-N-acetylglucosamine--N-acetylmuramyl-(pentapeptide) pyrophosphoryl-undecaprenol N-acetylglucosamine transferase